MEELTLIMSPTVDITRALRKFGFRNSISKGNYTFTLKMRQTNSLRQ